MDAGAFIAPECLVSASQEAILAAVPGFCDSDADSGDQFYDLTRRQVPEDSILPVDPSGNVFLGSPPDEIGVEEAAGTGSDAELGQSQLNEFSASLGNIDGMGTQVWSMSMACLQTPGSQGKEVNSSAAIAMDDLAGCSSPAFNRTSRTTKPSDEGEQPDGETSFILELPIPAEPAKSSDSAPNAEASPSLEQRFLSGGPPSQQTGTPASVCSSKSRVPNGSGQRVSVSPPPVVAIDVPRQESCVVVTAVQPEDAAASKPGFETPVKRPNVDDEDLEMRRVLSNPNHVSAKRLLSAICSRLNKSLPDKRRRVEEELLSPGSRQRLREETSCQLEHLYGAAGAEAATKLSSPSFVQAFEAVSGGPRRIACEDHGFAEFSAALKRRCYRLPPFT